MTDQPNTPSPFEDDAAQRRRMALEAQDQARIRESRLLSIKQVRRMVSRVLHLDDKASSLESTVSRFDTEDSFRDRVLAHRRRHWERIAFWGIIVFYVFVEFVSSGDISHYIASHLFAPLFDIQVESGEVPIWIRRVAGAAFVGSMLVATLAMKTIASNLIGNLRRNKAALQPGESGRFWAITSGLGLVHFSKVVYLLGVFVLYAWLFGFAQERARIVTGLVEEQQATQETLDYWSPLGLSAEAATKGAEPLPDNDANKSKAATLAGAIAVLYALLVFLHGAVLYLPNGKGDEPIEFAGFKRESAVRESTELRAKERDLLQSLSEQVVLADPSSQLDLVMVVQPVKAKINKLFGREIIPSNQKEKDDPQAPQWDNEPINGHPSGAIDFETIFPNVTES